MRGEGVDHRRDHGEGCVYGGCECMWGLCVCVCVYGGCVYGGWGSGVEVRGCICGVGWGWMCKS